MARADYSEDMNLINRDVMRTCYINVREYRRGNQTWTIQRNWQHRRRKTSKNTTQYMLDTNIRKQTQIK